jgi:hypothetical protein
MTYTELKEALMRQYSTSDLHHTSALEEVRCTGTVHEFNTEFMKKAAAAMPVMGEYAVKQQYVRALRPFSLQDKVRPFVNKDLNKVMQKALLISQGSR